MNIIELAKSSRSTCRTCKQKIEKLIPRIGVEYSFTKGGSEITGKRWHHVDCAIAKIPDEIITAEINSDIPEEYLDKIKQLKERLNRSAFSIKGISELDGEQTEVNTEGTVVRTMKPRLMINPEGEDVEGQTIYLDFEGTKRKVVLWGKHIGTKIKKDDRLVIISGLTELGSDEKILVNVTDKSTLLINPTQKEIDDHAVTIELYKSDKWEKPKGKYSLFEYAKTGRASCFICKEKINKGELKIIKPIWGENEKTKSKYPGAQSYHLLCTKEDEHGMEVLHEALSRITPEIISENHDIIEELNTQLEKTDLSKLIQSLM